MWLNHMNTHWIPVQKTTGMTKWQDYGNGEIFVAVAVMPECL